jgi:phage-related minor tail protein
MALPKLVVELAAKIREYMADLDEAATATEASAARIERADETIADAARDAATGQATMADTAVQVASRMGPVGGVVAAAAAVVAGYAAVSYKAAQENTALVRALALSGNQAGVTAGQLQGMAAAASQVVGTHGQAAQAIGLMVSGGKVAGENLQALTVTALNASRTLGIGVQETVKHYEALADSPAKASAKLNETMGYLNAETYRRIQALEEMGRKDEAAALAQQTYAKGVDDATKKVEASLGTLQRGWRNVGEAAGKAWDWMLGLGRKDEVQDSLGELRAKLAAEERKLRGGFATTGGGAAVGLGGPSAAQRAEIEATAEGLREQIRLMGRAGATAAQNAAASAKYQQESIEWSAKAAAAEERLKSNATKRADAIADANERLAMGYITQVERNNLVADAEQRYADKVTKGNDGERERLRLLKLQQHDLDELVKQILAREKAEHDAGVAATKAYDQVVDRQDKAVAAAEKELEQQLALNAAMGLSKQAVAELAAAKLEETAATKERQAALADEIDWSGRMGDAYRDEAAALYALAKAKRDGAAKETRLDNDKAWKKEFDDMAREGQRAAQKIEDSLTDALMRGFESGKGFLRNLADTAVNMFKTMVLRPVIQGIVQTGMGYVGMGPGGSAGAGGGSAMQSAAFGNFGPGYNSFATSSAGQYLGLSTPGTVDVMGDGVWASSPQLTTFGQNAGQYVQAAGQVLGYANALNTAFSRNAQGGKDYGKAAGQAIGTFFGGPIGSFIGGELGPMLGLMDYGGTYHTGAIGSYSATGGARTGASALSSGMTFGLEAKDYSAAGEKVAAGFAKGIVGILDSTATTFGKKAGYEVGVAFADDISPDSAWGALFVKLGETVLTDWKDGQDRWPGREFADGDAGLAAYQAAVALDIRDYLVTQTPDWADAALNALGDSVTLENLAATVTQINATEDALQGMGRASKAFADMGEEASNTLIKALGGAQAAAQSMGSYYGNFYSATERQTITRNQLTAAAKTAGIDALPTDRAGYRALVDSTLASGNTALAGALITWSDAFASITEVINTGATQVASVVSAAAPQISEFDKAVTDLAQVFKDASSSLTETGQSLSIDLMRALGDEMGAAQAERAQYLAGFAQLSQAERDRLGSLYDQNQAIRDQISAIEKAKAVADERKGIERQLLELTGDTAAIRALELAALDPTNRAMQARVYALEDEKTALEAATKAAETASQAFLQLVNAAYGSADRFLDAANSREFKLAVLAHKLTQAGGLEDTQSYANAMGGMTAEDVKSFVTQFIYSGASAEQKSVILEIGNSLLDMLDKSAEASKTAAKLIADERYGLEAKLLQLQGNTVALRERELALLDPTNRALQSQIWLMEDTVAAAEKVEAAAKELQSAGKGIAEWIAKTRASMGGTQTEAQTLAGLRANYLSDLSASRGNNLDALGNITGSADAYIKAAIDQSNTATQARATVAQVLAEMTSLPAVQSYEMQSLALLGKIDTSTATSATLTAAGIAASLAPAFDGIDLNMDGALTFAELQTALAGKASDAELRALFAMLDTDNDGIISRLEATKINTATSATLTAAGIAASLAPAFDGIDLNMDGALTFAELQTALAGKASDAELRALFAMLDTDNDGIISRLEATKTNTANIKSNFWDLDQYGIAAATKYHSDMLWHTVTSTAQLMGIVEKLHNGVGVTETSAATQTALLTNTRDYSASIYWQLVAIAEQSLATNQTLNAVKSGAASWQIRGATSAFASGGVFTNSIVSSPTAFNMGLMGEAGPEAIMPLTSIGGSLGVRYAGPDFSDFGRGMQAMAAEITALRAEVQGLRAEARATAVNTGRTQDLLKRVSRNGEALQTEAAT